MEGSLIKKAGPVTICISPEAKDLLDAIMEAWEEHYEEVKKRNPVYTPSYYSFAYWLVRWSGLIKPS